MNKKEENTLNQSEFTVKGLLAEENVRIPNRSSADRLSSGGYGVSQDKEFRLAFFEALYLLDKGMLEVEDTKGKKVDFQKLLQRYEGSDGNAWVKYLAYRDLRSRGYVVREGFGLGVDFRVYERGEYSKNTAKYLILSIQEGKPTSLETLTNVLKQCQSLKKELILAVMNRRGEIVYYSVSQLTLR